MYFKYKKTVFSYKRKKIRDCDKKIYVFFFFFKWGPQNASLLSDWDFFVLIFL